MRSARSLLCAGSVVSAVSFVGAPLVAQVISTQPAGLSFAVTTESGGSRLQLYKIGANGVATMLQEDLFPGNSLGTFTPGDQIVDSASGKVYFKEPPQGGAQARYRIYNALTNEFEGYTSISGTSDDANAKLLTMPFGIKKVVNKKCTSSDGSTCLAASDFISLGGEGAEAIATIDDEGLTVGGKSIVRREINAAGEEELHIGENSLVTVESDGVQKLYATDANGKKIPINITEGSDLQINGVSVQGQINTNAAGILSNSLGIKTNAAGIEENKKDINNLKGDVKNLGSGIAGATALSAALSSLPATSDDAPFSCGVGTGGYSSRYAMGVGCAARINERLSFNAGGSVLFGGASDYGSGTLDTMAGRAGFVFKLGAITPSNGQTNEQLQSKLQQVETHNAEMAYQLESLQQRLNQLEALALGASKSQSVSTSIRR